MSIPRKVDDVLFDYGFEKFSHWSACNIDKDNFFWFRVSIFFFLIALGWEIVVDYRLGEIEIVNIPFYCCWSLYFIFSVHREKDIKKRILKNCMNPLRGNEAFMFLRFSFFILLLFNCIFSSKLNNIIQNILFVCIFYFEACTPLPPSESKNKIGLWLAGPKQIANEG